RADVMAPPDARPGAPRPHLLALDLHPAQGRRSVARRALPQPSRPEQAVQRARSGPRMTGWAVLVLIEANGTCHLVNNGLFIIKALIYPDGPGCYGAASCHKLSIGKQPVGAERHVRADRPL